MSIWTHVSAIIRIDTIGPFGLLPRSKKDIETIIDSKACSLPCGSEGALKYNIWENEDEHCIAAFTVSIFGDLRDYSETDSIEKWFFNFCNSFPIIRQAVCLAQTEGYEPKVFQYRKDIAYE